MIIALDACTIIYLIEGGPPLGDMARARFRELLRDPLGRAVCSRLARLECRVGPLRVDDVTLLGRYDAFFQRRRLRIDDVSATVIELATELRARYRFKTPDAIHLATAIEAHADLFLTGDADLRRCAEAKVEVLQP